MERAGAARDHRNGSWEAHPRALSRRGAQDRGPIRGARQKGVLQRPDLPPRRPEVSHPGWGSRGQRDGWIRPADPGGVQRSEEHTSELQSLAYLVCRLLLEKKKKTQ